MPRLHKIDSLKKACKLNHGQLNAQDLLNGRIDIKFKGWVSVQLTPEFREELANLIAIVLGGHYATKQRVIRSLTYGNPQHWGLERIFVEYSKTLKCHYLTYCAGQDYPYECNEIRTYLKNN